MISLIKNKNREKNLTTFLNPFSYLVSRRNKSHLDGFNIEIDGALLVILLNFFGFTIKRRSFDMTSLAPIVFKEVIDSNKTIYFIGTKPEVIDLAVQNIRYKYPLLNIVGFRHGYIKSDQWKNVFKEIRSLKSDYVICGMGTPIQEDFLIDLKKSGWQGIGYTCGGFLHQTANSINYYPRWISTFGLRAFYRMYDEPKLIRRYILDYPKAVAIILYDLIQYKISW